MHSLAGQNEQEHPAPFLQFDNFLAPERLDALLDFVDRRQGDLSVSVAGADVADAHEARVTQTLYEVDEVWPLFGEQLEALLPTMRKELGVPHFRLQHTERQLAVHFEGDGYGPHSDNGGVKVGTRALTYVYYFNRQPARFEGGEMRMYNFVERDGQRHIGTGFHDVEPRHNSIVFFPSWVHHEVLPLVAEVDGLDGARMTFTGWYHAEETEVQKSAHVIEHHPDRRAAMQRRQLPAFTAEGFVVEPTPLAVHEALRAVDSPPVFDVAPPELSAVFVDKVPGLIDISALDSAVVPPANLAEALRPHLEQWSGQAVEYTTSSGIWRAVGGETVRRHVNLLESQVLSALIHIDGDAWPVHFEDRGSRLQQVTLEPGQMLMYEGATCAWARPEPFAGSQSTWLEVHFRPVSGWNFTERDILSRPP